MPQEDRFLGVKNENISPETNYTRPVYYFNVSFEGEGGQLLPELEFLFTYFLVLSYFAPNFSFFSILLHAH